MFRGWFKYAGDDFAGGIVSAAVAIPLAVGYGMFALASLGENYFAAGALAGLASALLVAIACALLGDKTATVYAPRVNSTFFLGLLIYGLIHSGAPEITAGGVPLILAIAFSVVLVGGAFEALFGLVRLGTLIKFAPQPVMAGFQNAAALLLFLVQLGNVCGFDHNVPFTQVPAHWMDIKPLSVIIAAITFAAMWNSRKLLPKVPPMLVGIVLGCTLYYLCRLLGLGTHLGPVIANGQRAELGVTAFPYFFELKHGGDLLAFAPTIVAGALALAIIASIDALLCTKLVTAPGEPRRDGDRILLRLGIGNIAAACFGGITSGINIGASVTNRAFGGRTPLSVLVNAAALLIAIALFRWLGNIPRVALSAVIMVIAVQHFDLWSLRLLGRLRDASTSLRISTVFDLLVVIVVAVLSIELNIVVAVFIGLALAVVLFVFHMSRSIVRRTYRCDAVHSRKSRTGPEREFLDRAGGAVLVMDLQGALFFGTGETMAKAIESALGPGMSCIILDLRRLTEMDSTGTSVLLDLQENLNRRKIDLLLAAGPHSAATQRLAEYGALPSFAAHLFPDVDRAIERAEDDLLRAHEPASAGEIALSEAAVFAGFEPRQLSAVTALMVRQTYTEGSVVFREGDPGDEVMIVTQGTASAYLQLQNGANVRLATFVPGTVFGEVAILDRGPRTASVIADGDFVCYAMSRDDYAALAEKSPGAAIQFMAAVGRELSGRLRTANRTIHELEA
ncbi:MAG TPA: SulP family inorganic anion transporter [Xanthobacteraceae bacterium]|nr:SulP family inorganic anion transporter [Xanthobacteraceae bacterium]